MVHQELGSDGSVVIRSRPAWNRFGCVLLVMMVFMALMGTILLLVGGVVAGVVFLAFLAFVIYSMSVSAKHGFIRLDDDGLEYTVGRAPPNKIRWSDMLAISDHRSKKAIVAEFLLDGGIEVAGIPGPHRLASPRKRVLYVKLVDPQAEFGRVGRVLRWSPGADLMIDTLGWKPGEVMELIREYRGSKGVGPPSEVS